MSYPRTIERIGFKIEITNKSKEVYSKLKRLDFCFNNSSKEQEKINIRLKPHNGYVFKSGSSCYVGSSLDYEEQTDYYNSYTQFSVTEDEFLNYVRFKNLKCKESIDRIKLLGDLWKSYNTRILTIPPHSPTI